MLAQRIIWVLVGLLASMLLGAEFPIAGTWEGTTNDLPAVVLTIKNNDGRISGTIGFYFQTRGGDGKFHLGEKTTVPLLSAKLNGSILTFETIHHKRHGSEELGPNKKYRVNFIDANEARLNILDDQAQDQKDDSKSGLKLTRRK